MKNLTILFWFIILCQWSALAYANSENLTHTPPVWKANLNLGLQSLPNYNDDGESEGLNKTRPYGSFVLDSRWVMDGDSEFRSDPYKYKNVFNAGAKILMLGTGAVKEEGEAGGAPTKFSEISDTVDSSLYFQWVPSDLDWPGGSEFGFIYKAGMITRDSVSTNKDTLNRYHKFGIKYTYIKPEHQKYYRYSGEYNGYLDISVARFSEYAGKKGVMRWVIDAQYQLIEDKPWFLGLYANTKHNGPDEFYLTMSIRSSLKKLVDAFGI